jgi:predicted Ser/Thr protein kinase
MPLPPNELPVTEALVRPLQEASPWEGQFGPRFHVERELGRGGFGQVLLARDEKLLRRKVVLKVLLPNRQSAMAQRDWIEVELRALINLQHANIVRVYDTGELDDGRRFLVMEYVEGRPLTRWLAPQGMPVAQVAEIMKQLGAAVDAAHQAGVIHRDLKPDNILIHYPPSGALELKLIDFGVARSGSERGSQQTESGAVLGTVRYMAPEQMEGAAVAASDQFALGLIAFQMLTGRMPVQEDSPIQLFTAYVRGSYPKPTAIRPELPAELDPVLATALSYSPKARFGRVQEFTEALGRALRGSAGVSRPVSPAAGGRIIPKLCDRRLQEDHFKVALQERRKVAGGCLVLVPGPEAEGHDSLVERCFHTVARGSSGPAGLLQAPWPYEGDLRLRRQRLIGAALEQLTTGAEYEFGEDPYLALSQAVRRRPTGLTGVAHEIRASRWDQESAALLREYARALAQLPSAEATGWPLLVFVKLIFPASASGGGIGQWVNAFRHNRLRGQLRQTLEDLARGGAAVVLPELQPVAREDVLEWFSLYNVLESEQRRLEISSQIFPRDRDGLRLPMAAVEAFLEQVHQHSILQQSIQYRGLP